MCNLNYNNSKELAEKIDAIKQGIYVAGFWIIAILVIIALVIVSNTIRVTMYNRKLEISIMKAVGATDTFVRIPFLVEGLIIGIISALISEELTSMISAIKFKKSSIFCCILISFVVCLLENEKHSSLRIYGLRENDPCKATC